MTTKLIAGIGNPGRKYSKTRHNIGFRAIDYLSNYYNIPLDQEKKKSAFGRGFVKEKEVILLKPLTYASLCGESILYIVSFLKIDIKNLIIIYNDTTKDFGEISFKENEDYNISVKKLKEFLNDDAFQFLSVGIGNTPAGKNLEDYYLEEFTEQEETEINQILQNTTELLNKNLF